MSAARAAYERGMAAFRAGNLDEAERSLAAAVAADARFAEALQALGAVCGARGRHADSLAWLDRARALGATASLMHNRAQALFHLGRFAEARGELEAALAASPAQHPSWNLLGGVRAALGDIEGAREAYARALELRPDHAQTHFNLALLLHGSARLDEAIACYRRALERQPGLAAAREKLAEALNQRAFADFGAKRFAEAIAAYEEALRLRPGYHEARTNLGGALAAVGRFADAAACFRAVLAERREDPAALSDLGYALHALGDAAAARAHFERALAIDPAHADAVTNLGMLLQEQGRFDEAIAAYRRAIEHNPEAAAPRLNLGIALLTRFQFAEGWPLNEWRFRTTPPMTTPRQVKLPPFTAADWSAGRRTAIWGEQGVGDRLVYATLLPEFAARGEAFVLETDARLIPAFARSHPDWRVISREQSEAQFAACERGISNTSLAGLMRLSREDFERQPRALLAADPARAAALRERLAEPGARVIGISWRSFQPAARRTVQTRKSAALAHFERLSRRGDVKLVDLQYGDTAAEREAFARAGGRLARLEDLDLFHDIDGVLAAIEACDLVLTTSNVTAHFAGALGKRVLLVYLGAIPPFHYWATDADGRCLWYPSMRIVTGAAFDTWEKVLAAAEEAIG